MNLLPLLLVSSLMAQHHEPLAGPHGGAVRLNPPVKHWVPRSAPQARRGSIDVLPFGSREARHHGNPYFFAQGFWYRPSNGRYTLCYPPIGMWVTLLPAFSQTIVIAGVTYIVIEEVYYIRSGIGYEVVPPPIEGNCW